MPKPKFCASGWAGAVLRMDGRTLTCCRNPTDFGNWIENGVDGTWNAPEFVRFREKVIAGEYPDESCELCDSNGTALSLRQLLQRALDEYLGMARGARANGAEDIATIYSILDKTEPDAAFQAIIDKAIHRLSQWRLDISKGGLPADSSLFVAKLEKIITVVRDFVTGNVRPSVVAPFRQAHLIAVCNARCIHCPGRFTGEISEGAPSYQGRRLKEMPIEDVERSFAREDDIIDFFPNGSEFLLLKSWQDIARRLKAQGVRVRVSTNGMLLTRDASDLLVKNGYLGKLNVSLDGGTKEIVETVRVGVKYDRVIANLEYLLRLAAVKRYTFIFSLSFALMTDNYQTLPKFVELAARLRDINPAVPPTIMVQALTKRRNSGYADFLSEHHPSLISHRALQDSFSAMQNRAEALGIPVSVFSTYTLADFIARGCPIPNIDFLATDEAKVEDREAT